MQCELPESNPPPPAAAGDPAKLGSCASRFITGEKLEHQKEAENRRHPPPPQQQQLRARGGERGRERWDWLAGWEGGVFPRLRSWKVCVRVLVRGWGTLGTPLRHFSSRRRSGGQGARRGTEDRFKISNAAARRRAGSARFAISICQGGNLPYVYI